MPPLFCAPYTAVTPRSSFHALTRTAGEVFVTVQRSEKVYWVGPSLNANENPPRAILTTSAGTVCAVYHSWGERVNPPDWRIETCLLFRDLGLGIPGHLP